MTGPSAGHGNAGNSLSCHVACHVATSFLSPREFQPAVSTTSFHGLLRGLRTLNGGCLGFELSYCIFEGEYLSLLET